MTLEKLDTDLFRSVFNHRNVNSAIFGGQMLGQALAAASATVEGMVAHSLHGYFLRSGSAEQRVIFEVERTRNGKGFSTRRVVAIQDATPIFHAECSFRIPGEGFEHQIPSVPAPDPESLESLSDLVKKLPGHFGLFTQALQTEGPMEVRPTNPARDLYQQANERAHRRFWIRVKSASRVTDPAMHLNILAYLSDYWFSGISLMPHGLPVPGSDIFIASIDHGIWIHRPVRVDEWLLYDTESTTASAGTGFSRGMIYDRAGRLVASTVQETLQRRRR